MNFPDPEGMREEQFCRGNGVIGSGVTNAAVMGILADLSSRVVVTDGFVKLAEVENNGLDERVAFQYRYVCSGREWGSR